MSHPSTLIASIRNMLEKSYPSSQFDYLIEKSLNGSKPLMIPDIQIFRKDQHLVSKPIPLAIVEIGYTRPEKLKNYAEKYKIQDIRWYSKDGVQLNPFEIKSVVIKERPEDKVRFDLVILDSISNFGLMCEKCYQQIKFELNSDDNGQMILFNNTMEDEEIEDEAFEEAMYDLEIYVWSDGKWIFGFYFHDVCGEFHQLDRPEMEEVIDELSILDISDTYSFWKKSESKKQVEIMVDSSLPKSIVFSEVQQKFNNFDFDKFYKIRDLTKAWDCPDS